MCTPAALRASATICYGQSVGRRLVRASRSQKLRVQRHLVSLAMGTQSPSRTNCEWDSSGPLEQDA